VTDAPPQAADKRIRQLHEHWLGLHPAPGGLPGPQHFDAADVPGLLPHLWLAGVQRAPLRFRYRLLGTEHTHVFARDYTGHWLDETHPQIEASPGYRQYHTSPQLRKRASAIAADIRSLALPCRGNTLYRAPAAAAGRHGKTVDMLLAISLYHPRRRSSPVVALAD